jgi:flagellar motor component MotA
MRAIFALAGIGLLLVAMSFDHTPMIFFNTAAAAIVFGGTLFLSLATLGVEPLGRAFYPLPLDAVSVEATARRVASLTTVRSLALATAGVGVLIGLLQVLNSIDDPRAIGPGLHTTLLSALYGMIIGELAVGPLINRDLVDSKARNDTRGADAHADGAVGTFVRLIFTILGLGALVGGAVLLSPLDALFSAPSLVLVAGGMILLTLSFHSPRAVGAALQAGLGQNEASPDQAHTHLTVLSTARMLALGLGVVGAMIGLIQMLVRIDDPSAIGPAMAVALLCPVYGVICGDLLLAAPINRLRHRARSHDAPAPAGANHVALLAFLLTVIFSFFVMLFSMR